MSRRAFVVLGAEASGTRLMTEILIDGGCVGDVGHKQNIDSMIPNALLIVWRRSVPHGPNNPDIAKMIRQLRDKAYGVSSIVMVRDPFAMAQSQVSATHSPNLVESHYRQRSALEFIYNQLSNVNCPSLCVPYETLVARPQSVQSMLASYLLLPRVPKVKIYDGNIRYYESEM